MEGTITLRSSRVKARVDMGVTHSLFAVKIIQKLGVIPQKLDIALNTASPLGVAIKLGHVSKDCPLHLENRDLPANLIILVMKEFDVILGISWLTKSYAKLDYVKKRISFSVPRSQSFDFQCNLISDTFLTNCLEIGRAHV